MNKKNLAYLRVYKRQEDERVHCIRINSLILIVNDIIEQFKDINALEKCYVNLEKKIKLSQEYTIVSCSLPETRGFR